MILIVHNKETILIMNSMKTLIITVYTEDDHHWLHQWNHPQCLHQGDYPYNILIDYSYLHLYLPHLQLTFTFSDNSKHLYFDHMRGLSHLKLFHTFMLSYFLFPILDTFNIKYFHTLILHYFHTFKLLYFLALILSYCYTFTFSNFLCF